MSTSATAPTVRLRASRSWLVVVVFLLICVTPVAFVSRPLLVLYAVPAGVLVWLCRSGTDVDAGGLTARAVLGQRRLPWTEVRALSPSPRGQLRAVLSDGRLLRLPQAQLRHLAVIAAASDGHIRTEPATADEPPPTDPARRD